MFVCIAVEWKTLFICEKIFDRAGEKKLGLIG